MTLSYYHLSYLSLISWRSRRRCKENKENEKLEAQKEEEKTVEKVYFTKLNSILGYVKRNFVIIYYLQIALVPACFAFDVNGFFNHRDNNWVYVNT